MSKFADKLTRMFEQIEDQFMAEMIAQYRRNATLQLEEWLKLLDGPEPVGRERSRIRVPEFVTTTTAEYSLWWPDLQMKRREGKFVANYELAEREARAAVESAKVHFVTKQGRKLENATKNHAGIPQIGGSLRFHSTITGFLEVAYPGGDEFVLTMSIIVNHR